MELNKYSDDLIDFMSEAEEEWVSYCESHDIQYEMEHDIDSELSIHHNPDDDRIPF